LCTENWDEINVNAVCLPFLIVEIRRILCKYVIFNRIKQFVRKLSLKELRIFGGREA